MANEFSREQRAQRLSLIIPASHLDPAFGESMAANKDFYGPHVIVEASQVHSADVIKSYEAAAILVESLGKKLIPCLTFGSINVYNGPGFVDLTSPDAYTGDTAFVTDWVKDNLERFGRVLVGNSGCEMGTALSRRNWHSAMATGIDGPKELIKQPTAVLDQYPWLLSKMGIMPFCMFVDRDALFMKLRPDVPPAIRCFCQTTNTWLFHTTGACSLYETEAEYSDKYSSLHAAANYLAYAYGYHRPKREQVTFPLTHLREYVADFPVSIYGGLAWGSGGARGNLSKMLKMGWTGCFAGFQPAQAEAIFTETAGDEVVG